MEELTKDLYDIYGDLILIDQSEYVTRDYDVEESLDNGDVLLSYREAEYYTQRSYLDDVDKFMDNTNDKYRLDRMYNSRNNTMKR